MRYFLLIGSIFLFSTMMNPSFAASISSWRGKSVNQLLSVWGEPNELIQGNPYSYYTYVLESSSHQRTAGSPAIGVHVSQGKPIIVMPKETVTQSINLRCYITFTAKNNKIIRSKTEGDCAQILHSH